MQNLEDQKFDPDKFKETTCEQWQTAAQSWHRWGPVLDQWLGPATEVMLDSAGIVEGSRVLDVAAGAGGQTLKAAQRIGPKGYILATDISSNILDFCKHSAREAGLNNVETQVLDGEKLLELPENTFDAAISRVGLIYFPDKQKALKGQLNILKPGGKIGAMVYSTPEKNEFFSIPVSIIRRRAKLPPPLPGQPGPFSLGVQGALEIALEKSGFRDITIQYISAPLCLSSASECVQFEKESFGALHQMLSGLNDGEQEETWQEIEEALTRFENTNGFEGPCELIVATGVK
jgi:ubiquinone/menaquinone biosynthesis C-methylase UbiE